jgi:AraC family transcriptional regulator of adaptative response / DNA-3-methyladenine glycosylase II
VRERLDSAPGLRVPGCWNGFELAVRAILGQQVTVKGASLLAGRIAKSFGRPYLVGRGLTHVFPAPEVLANANFAGIGLPRARSETIRALSRAVCSGQFSFDGIVAVPDFLKRFCEIPGIGNWTAQYVAMRALGEPDAFPSGDLGLLRVLDLENPRELEKRAEAWRPWRAYAAMYLWNIVGKTCGASTICSNPKDPARSTQESERAAAV